MPQLDKVTIFSQVFWLLFLYFFFFLICIKCYLPNFSKLFKLRFYFSSILDKRVQEDRLFVSKNLIQILDKFKVVLNESISSNLAFHKKFVNHYNSVLLNRANTLFIFAYTYNCLKCQLFKKLYL